MKYTISILFTFVCFSAFPQSIRIPLHELEEAGDSGYIIRANALGDAEWYEITEYNGDTVIVWNPLTRKFGFIKKDSISTPLPDSLAYGTGTTNYLSKWIAPFTLGTAGITDDGSEIQFARPTVLYGVNTAAPATYGTFGIDNTLGIERPTYYNGSAWVPWLAYSGGTNQYSYFSNSNTITSGTQLFRSATGVEIGDGNYFKLPNASTVGAPTGAQGRTFFNTTFNQPQYHDGTSYRPFGEWFRSGSNIYFNTGDVGIGTSSPSSGFNYVSGVSDIRLSTGLLNLTPTISVINTNTGGKAAALSAGTSGAGFHFENTGFFAILSESKSAFTSNAVGSGVILVRLNNNGNFGIGAGVNPSYKLHVAGDATLSNGGTLRLLGGNASGQGNIQMGANPSNSYDSNILYTNANNKMIGIIASASPVAQASSGPYMIARGNTYNAIPNQRANLYLAAGNPSTPGANEGSIVFLTGADIVRLRIANDGQVRITNLESTVPTRVVGADADGDLGAISFSTLVDSLEVNGISSYSGFTPAADSGIGSNVASGGTLQVNGSGSISTSVSDTTVTIDNNRFGNYIYTEDSITVDGTNFFGDGIAIYKGFLFSMSNGADSLYVFDIYNDYNVVSKFPVAGTSSPFIHAWNDKLTVTRSDSIRVYDIKDLNTPILLYKQLPGVINFPTQYNQFVFSSGGVNDIYIFNTETFQTDTVIVPRSNVFQANSLAYDDGYLYAVGGDASPDSIFIVNTNTKSYVNAYGQDGVGTTTYTYIFAQDKYLYALRSDTIDILNLADPENPVLVSKTKSFSGSGPFTRGLKVYGNYLIHCFSGGGFVVYDISDKTNVVALDTVYTTIASNTRGFDIYDNKIYLLSRNEPTIVVYDLPSIETGHLRSATIHTGKVRAENLITKEIETQGLVTTDLVVNSNVIFSDYGAGNKTATALSKTDSGYRLGLATDGTVIEIPDSTPKTHIIARTVYDGDAALPDSTVAVNGTFNAGFWRVPESMDGYTLTKASFGIFDKGDMSTSGATYSFGVQKCNGSNMSCSNSSNVNFTPSSETELELTLSITLNANDILRVNYQPPQGCGGGCGTENVNGLVVTYTIQEN